jgi:hypothetical protein
VPCNGGDGVGAETMRTAATIIARRGIGLAVDRTGSSTSIAAAGAGGGPGAGGRGKRVGVDGFGAGDALVSPGPQSAS